MKKEEIEQLLADYITCEISPENKKQLEELFEKDPALKTEAGAMIDTWQLLNKLEPVMQPGIEMDSQFYAMLHKEKAGLPKSIAKVISINRAWLQAAAIIILCIAAFVVGRFTVLPVTTFKYKTVYIKQRVIQQQRTADKNAMLATMSKPAVNNHLDKVNIVKCDSELAQQLRSVYASERIAAITKITGKANLNNADLKSLELALKEDPNPNVRLTILNILKPLAKQPQVQQVLISALNQQDDVLVQSSIVDVLVDTKSKQAIPRMIALLDAKHTDIMVQNKIREGIESFIN